MYLKILRVSFLHNMKSIDNILNSLTMYKVLLYSLLVLWVYTIILSTLNLISPSVYSLLTSSLLLVSTCYIFNILLAKVFKVIAATDSSIITGLILHFVLTPAKGSLEEYLWLICASIFAIGSKYLLVYKKRHILNPAAFAAFILGVFGIGISGWWVAAPAVAPLTLLVSLLVVRKIRREKMFGLFVTTSILSIFIFQIQFADSPLELFIESLLSWPIFFFGSIMLTEPRTSPTTKSLQDFYAIISGLLFGAIYSIGPIHATPEAALIVGNIYTYIFEKNYPLILKFIEKKELAKNLYEFSFEKGSAFTFIPGQYMEFTINASKNDSRGNRRYFTIASSPLETELTLGLRIEQSGGSTYKNEFMNLKKGDEIVAASLGGDFTLRHGSENIVFIAGGIGITPFRSIISHLLKTNQKKNIVLFYACNSSGDFIYKDVFEKAKTIGIKVIYIVTNKEITNKDWQGEKGYLTIDMIKKYTDKSIDTYEYYLSGPNSMVQNYENMLKTAKVPHNKIRKDFFPGY